MNHGQLVETLDASIETHAFSGVVSIRHHGQPVYERSISALKNRENDSILILE